MGEAHGQYQKSVPVVGGNWMAALLAALWQLSKLLAMHAGGVAADTGRLLKGGRRPCEAGEEAEVAVQCSSGGGSCGAMPINSDVVGGR